MTIKKIGLAILYLGIAGVIYIYGGHLMDWLAQATVSWIPLTIIISTIMALFPIIPYPIVGGVLGAAYGSGLGALLTWIGSSCASILMFLFIRYGYQDWGIQWLHQKNKWVGKATALFEKNAFLAIFFSRLIPIIPSIIINIYSALSRVKNAPYMVASTLGKIPAMFLFALLGDQLISNPKNMLITLSVYLLFLAITFYFYRLWEKRFPVQGYK